MKCGFCNTKLVQILNLGKTPLANSFLTKNFLGKKERKYKLSINYCKKCFLVQAPRDVESKEIFNEKYVYYSSTSKYWTDHARKYCKNIIKKINLKKNSQIIEIASNDGYLLRNFDKKKYRLLGIEPSKNTARFCEKKYKIKVIKNFFKLKTIAKYNLNAKADLLIANNVFAHNPDINDFVESISETLSPKGVATIEFPHFYNLFKELQFDTIYHEHFYYFTLKSILKIFSKYKLRVWDVEELKTHGGSLRIYISHQNSNKKIQKSISRVLKKEQNLQLFQLKTFSSFSKRVNLIKIKTLKFLKIELQKGKKIAFYGAAAKGNTFLNFLRVNNKKINHIFDLSKPKIGKYLPGSKIKVFYPHKKIVYKFDIIIILPWNLKYEIALQLQKKIKKNCEIYVCIPEIKKIN